MNGVQGLAPGIYLHHPQLRAVELIRGGTFRTEATRIAAAQQYAGNAHMNLYYLAPCSANAAPDPWRAYQTARQAPLDKSG